MATFRKVRKLRQRPAHKLTENKHDESLFETQRLLFVEAYVAIRTLRQVLENHPRARSVADDMDQLVRSGNISGFLVASALRSVRETSSLSLVLAGRRLAGILVDMVKRDGRTCEVAQLVAYLGRPSSLLQRPRRDAE